MQIEVTQKWSMRSRVWVSHRFMKKCLHYVILSGILCFVTSCGGGEKTASQPGTPQADPAAAASELSFSVSFGGSVDLTGIDAMKYNITEIVTSAGSEITVNLTNTGTMPKVGMAHNFVLLKMGTDAEDFSLRAAMAGKDGYIPPDAADEILAMTGLAGPGETVSVTFTVPAEPGRYEYVCTFPGHFLAGMGGILVVN